MRTFHSNTQPAEFLDWLRYAAIGGNMGTLFIEKVDELYDFLGKDDELEKLGEELTQTQEAKDDLLSELSTLIAACKTVQRAMEMADEGFTELPPTLVRALAEANSAIKRHET